MLNLSKSTISRSVERAIAEGFTVTAEGSALVAVSSNGAFGVRPSTAAAGEKFMGVSLSQQLTLEILPAVESLTVPATPYTVTLQRTPLAGTIRVFDNTAGAVIDNANITVVGKDLTFLIGVTLHAITVYYRFAPSVIEAKTLQGDIPPGGAAGLLLGSVGVIEVGDVYTSEYDTSADWSAAAPVVRLGANGLFTTAGAGVILDVVVISAPTVTDAFLGLRLG